MIICQLPELVADASDQKGILANHGRRELVVNQVRQNSWHLLAAPKEDAAASSEPLARFDRDPARAIGIKRLNRVTDWVRPPARLGCGCHVCDLQSVPPSAIARQPRARPSRLAAGSARYPW